LVVAAAVAAGACAQTGDHATQDFAVSAPAGEFAVVHTVEVPAVVEASGVARPFVESTLSTKLMATVLRVHVREGDRVRAGDVLVELDARDLDAKAGQVEASLAEANAVLNEATVHAERMLTLYAEEAAPKAQLDAAETGLLRAKAAVEAARAAAAELTAVRDYSVVRLAGCTAGHSAGIASAAHLRDRSAGRGPGSSTRRHRHGHDRRRTRNRLGGRHRSGDRRSLHGERNRRQRGGRSHGRQRSGARASDRRAPRAVRARGRDPA
jgi:multidrug efflux pump subunit AcrA (membrane-fusion protein)